MRIHLLYFGVLKDLFATPHDSFELPESASVADLVTLLQQSSSNRFEAWDTLAIAVNREYAQPGTILHEGDEVALLPPVSGGTSSPCA